MAESKRNAFAEVKLKKVNRSFGKQYTSKVWSLPKLQLTRSHSEECTTNSTSNSERKNTSYQGAGTPETKIRMKHGFKDHLKTSDKQTHSTESDPERRVKSHNNLSSDSSDYNRHLDMTATKGNIKADRNICESIANDQQQIGVGSAIESLRSSEMYINSSEIDNKGREKNTTQSTTRNSEGVNKLINIVKDAPENSNFADLSTCGNVEERKQDRNYENNSKGTKQVDIIMLDNQKKQEYDSNARKPESDSNNARKQERDSNNARKKESESNNARKQESDLNNAMKQESDSDNKKKIENDTKCELNLDFVNSENSDIASNCSISESDISSCHIEHSEENESSERDMRRKVKLYIEEDSDDGQTDKGLNQQFTVWKMSNDSVEKFESKEHCEPRICEINDVGNNAVHVKDNNITNIEDIGTIVGKVKDSVDDTNEAVDNIELIEEDLDSEMNVEVTIEFDKSSAEDEEVKNIMESCEELDKGYLRARSVGDMATKRPRSQNERWHKKSRRERKYEEIGRQRSKSIDAAALNHFDFARYGISVGHRMPHDLLPGIEEFLCNVLANEALSTYAEEQRQYYLERLDIIKLPPSIPPRPQSLGVPLFPVSCTPPSSRDSLPSVEQEDFAAYQRELSRALETSPVVTEFKVYDDIDTADTSITEISPLPVQHNEEESMYEVPQLRRTLSDSGYEKAVELSPMSKSTSSDEQIVLIGAPIPPPLPPRRDRTASDAASRSSIGSILEDRVPEVPKHGLRLSRKHSMPNPHDKSFDTRSERSERSSDDLLLDEDYDGLSCDSMDDVSGSFLQPSEHNLSIKLPRPTRRKARAQRKLGKSLSSLWEITQPFRALEDIVISGELYYKSKLSWTKKLVALTNGRLVCYKADKPDSRPSFVIMLTGYLATFHKREGRRSHEIHLDHDNFEPHVFLVDFIEWAETWCDHLNAAAEGKRAPGPVLHLARDSLADKHDPSTYQLEKSPGPQSNSNVSLASCDGYEADTGRTKKRDHSATRSARMGTIAHKASQFFESLGRKASVKKPSRSSSSERIRTPSSSEKNFTSDDGLTGSDAYKCLIGSQLGSETSLLDTVVTPMTPESVFLESPMEISPEVAKHIKHQGYLDIYSSFNKRKWGKRWCMIHENNFECYRSPTSEICELEFLLRSCVLRRAIEETKSELGLMLLENNREKITIEPCSWSELGSWLRVLMKETSTGDTPDGLQGYMDDSHPYHEAVEITRKNRPSTERKTENGKKANRDSGICSSESNDGKFGSLERAGTSPAIHKCYTDSSLPRVSVADNGAIYTLVKKTSPANKKTTSASLKQNDLSNAGTASSGNTSNSLITDSGTFELDEDKLFSEFEKRISGPEYERGESLVDEIMSQLDSQMKKEPNTTSELNNVDNIKDENLAKNIQEISGDIKENVQDIPNDNSDVSVKVTISEHETNKQLNAGTNDIKTSEHLLNESTAKDIDGTDFSENSCVRTKKAASLERNMSLGASERLVKHSAVSKSKSLSRNASAEYKSDFMKKQRLGKKSSSIAYSEIDPEERLAELRTRLVQLKQDRIMIRDRRQNVTAEIDREFLTAEFERLNRECSKVTEEIKAIEEEMDAEKTDKINEIDDEKPDKINKDSCEKAKKIECKSDKKPKAENVNPEKGLTKKGSTKAKQKKSKGNEPKSKKVKDTIEISRERRKAADIQDRNIDDLTIMDNQAKDSDDGLKIGNGRIQGQCLEKINADENTNIDSHGNDNEHNLNTSEHERNIKQNNDSDTVDSITEKLLVHGLNLITETGGASENCQKCEKCNKCENSKICEQCHQCKNCQKCEKSPISGNYLKEMQPPSSEVDNSETGKQSKSGDQKSHEHAIIDKNYPVDDDGYTIVKNNDNDDKYDKETLKGDNELIGSQVKSFPDAHTENTQCGNIDANNVSEQMASTEMKENCSKEHQCPDNMNASTKPTNMSEKEVKKAQHIALTLPTVECSSNCENRKSTDIEGLLADFENKLVLDC